MSYIIASDLNQALQILRDSKGQARVIAGATDLFLQTLPAELVDLAGLYETTQLEETGGLLSIGSAVTHASAARSLLIRSQAAALAEACAMIGSPQVRNIGTIGGNVANAAPAADAAVALVALGAKAVITDIAGQTRVEAVEELYAGYNRSTIDSSSEIIGRLLFKSCAAGEGSAFMRFAPRRALALPLVNAAARVRVSGRRIEAVRLVAAPVKPAPTRLFETEALLQEVIPGPEIWPKVEEAAAEVEVRGSMLRCSEQYRRHLVGTLAGRVLKEAYQRACAAEGGETR